MKTSYLKFIITLSVLILSGEVFAQFSISGQVLQRSEYRHGFGTLADTAVNPAIFTGQRSRINFNYIDEKVRFGASIQDIRIWGNTPQIKFTDGFLSVHEAWGEYLFSNKFSAKLGRQELNYHDFRFLGNLDWALQARAHDIAVLKYEDSTWFAHAGFAYNQDQERLFGNFYEMTNQYKAAQYLWMQKRFTNFQISAMFWNNGLQYLEIDQAGVRNERINYSQTFGLPQIEYTNGALTFHAFYYHQTGKDIKDRDINAFDASAEVSYAMTLNEEKKNKLRFTTGFEYLSGTSQIDTANRQNNSFNPFYGTNHRFNGYMDYFYVGSRHNNSVGLLDAFLKVRYDFNPKFFTSINAHYFMAAADVRDKNQPGLEIADPYLGTEIDFTFGYLLSNSLSIQGGYSQIFASETMEFLRGGDRNQIQNWGYVALLYRPGIKARFVGLKF
jgi:hypothetical protein